MEQHPPKAVEEQEAEAAQLMQMVEELDLELQDQRARQQEAAYMEALNLSLCQAAQAEAAQELAIIMEAEAAVEAVVSCFILIVSFPCKEAFLPREEMVQLEPMAAAAQDRADRLCCSLLM